MDYVRTSTRNCKQEDFLVDTQGENTIKSPLSFKKYPHVRKLERGIFNQKIPHDYSCNIENILSFEIAMPHEYIYYDPAQTNVGIVTCGGLCPGINDVIRSITYASFETYGVKNVYGFRYGYAGLTAKFNQTALRLRPEMVDEIHEQGGTILGSSRGAQSVEDMVDTLIKFNISILYVIGGDGTQRGSMAIVEEIKRRKLDISVIGIPKTIDNDIAFVEQTFGFLTAVDEARKAINAAHAEAKGALHGIGLVKLMGRHSGFIAAHATLASGNANMCLIPEEHRSLPDILEKIEHRFTVKEKDHLVIVVAEGFGQDLLLEGKEKQFDPSGNVKLADIGPFLVEKIGTHLKEKKTLHTIKYIDPSYTIRSIRSNATDSSFCLQLGNYAVHAGMAGRTNCLIGFWNSNFNLLPIKLALSSRKIVDVEGPMWGAVKEITI